MTRSASSPKDAQQWLQALREMLESQREKAPPSELVSALSQSTQLSEADRPTLLEIVRLGHPTLRQVAQPVPKGVLGTSVFRAYARSLVASMFEADGVGLASPQVAEPLRCFVYCVPSEHEAGSFEVPPTVLVNPTFQSEESSMVEGWEGCLSIPGMRGLVPRYDQIQVEALDIEGKPVTLQADGFHSRVIQHEYDHLDGVVFLDRMRSMESLAFEAEWMRYTIAAEDEE